MSTSFFLNGHWKDSDMISFKTHIWLDLIDTAKDAPIRLWLPIMIMGSRIGQSADADREVPQYKQWERMC